MRRQLGQMERALVYVDELASLFIVIALRLANGPPPEVLERALAMLQRRHPLLRMQIVQDSGRYWFQEPADVPPISLQIKERYDDRQWETITEDEKTARWIPSPHR